MDGVCCIECFESADVRALVQGSGSPEGGPCGYCGGVVGPFVEVGVLTDTFRRLVKNHYCLLSALTQAAHVNPFRAGSHLQELLDNDFAVFATTSSGELLFDILNDGLYGSGSEGYGDPTELYASVEDDATHVSLADYWRALESIIHRYGHSYKRASGADSGFESAKELCDILQEQLPDIEMSLDVSTPFWRARRGAGHTEKALAAPPPHLATAGRGNIQGQPVLYLCTERGTAVSEVRPSVGDVVSVARFRLSRQVRVCDLRPNLSAITPFVESDEEFIEYIEERGRNEAKRALGRALSKPVRRDDEAKEYLATQVLVQLIADAGFDGVAYESSQAPGGSNFLFFDPDISTQEGVAEEVEVTGVSYAF